MQDFYDAAAKATAEEPAKEPEYEVELRLDESSAYGDRYTLTIPESQVRKLIAGDLAVIRVEPHNRHPQGHAMFINFQHVVWFNVHRWPQD